MLIENLSLNANDDITKSQVFTETISNNDFSQTGLVTDSKCSDCNKASIPIDCVVSCGCCSKHYHITCVNHPVHYDTAAVIRENPSLWWVCLTCASSKSSGNSVSATKTPDDKLGELVDKKLEKN